MLPGLSDSARARVLAAATPCRFRGNQSLFRSGEPANALFFLISGRVRVSRETARHIELLHTEQSGGVLGEIPMFGGGVYPATAIATEPTQCLRLSRAEVERLLNAEPEFARYALTRMAQRAQSFLHRIDELTATTIAARVAAHVAARATDGAFDLGMSQAALAEDIGTAREVVVRALRALVDAGAIRRMGRSRFEIANWAILRSLAGPADPKASAQKQPP
jgi:CRP-like cAMP-binding protein